jgi:hypothetical protein
MATKKKDVKKNKNEKGQFPNKSVEPKEIA